MSGISGTGATLTIAGHTAAWWYDADTGPDTTCQSVTAGTASDTLTGLTDGNTYTYTAYSKTGCNAVDELDSVTFSTSDVSVGNLGEQADNASCSIGYSGANNVKCATSFTTGSNSAGYTLKSVTGLFDAKFRNPGDIVVAVHAADGGNPAAAASATLSGSDPDGAGLHTYTCSGNACDLTANTTYFVVMSTADASGSRKLYSWRRTTSDDETVRPSTATGWAIANAGLQDIGSGWTALPRNHTGVMHVAADEKPPVTVSNLSETLSPGWQLIGQNWTQNRQIASGFTTGSNTDGYGLHSVTVRIISVSGSPTGYTVAIHANSSGNPAGTATYTLTGDAPTGAGDYTYTCSSSCDLTASTKYFLVLSGSGANTGNNTFEQRTTGSSSETNTPSNAGWSIDDLMKKRENGGSWSTDGLVGTLKFKVTAMPKTS